jgi:regulatory factor X
MSSGMGPSVEDLYHASYHLGHQNNGLANDHHVRGYVPNALAVANDDTHYQSPPNHNISNPALKGHLRPSHIRARAAASPYPRDTDSVHSSSSETDDIAMFLGNSIPDYSMFGGSQSMAPNPETMHAAGAFGRMTLSPDHALEKLAANVRAATTTSASDRAKQIFVQAWWAFTPYLRSAALFSIFL